jgi:uncharacterized peroxidase-related enzyme
MTEDIERIAWIDLPSEEEIRERMPKDRRHPYDFGFLANMARLNRAHKRIAGPMGALSQEVLFAPGHLSRAEREMIAAVASAAQDCHYWTQSHAEFLRTEHGRSELVEAIKEKRWREIELSPRERALCEVAEKMSAFATRMTEKDWQPLRDLDFNDEALLEVGHVVAYFNYMTRLADGFGLQLDKQTEEAGRTGIPLKRPS